MEIVLSHNSSCDFVAMATPTSSTSVEAEAMSSQQIMGLHQDSIHVIRPYTKETFSGKNWSAFEFEYIAHLIGYNLVAVLYSKEWEKSTQNKVYFISITTLKSNQFVLVNKASTLAQACAALKSFYCKKGGQSVLLLMQKFRHAKMMDSEDLYHHMTTMSNLADELDEVMGMKITDEDFMTIVCFSIIGIPRYTNIVEIVMNGPALGRGDLMSRTYINYL